MRPIYEIIKETLLEETPFTEEKCEQLANKLTKRLGMEKIKIIEGADFKPSQKLLAHLLDTAPNSPFVVGEVAEEREFAELAKKISGTEIPIKYD